MSSELALYYTFHAISLSSGKCCDVIVIICMYSIVSIGHTSKIHFNFFIYKNGGHSLLIQEFIEQLCRVVKNVHIQFHVF